MESTQASEPIQVPTVLMVMVEEMAGLAWQKMGLRPDPITQKIEKDMAQARMAIDAAIALGDLLLPSLDDSDKRQVKNLASDLRINFVQQGGGQDS